MNVKRADAAYRSTNSRHVDAAERMFMLACVVVIAWFVGGGVIWLVGAIWVLDSLPKSVNLRPSIEQWRPAAVDVLLPALVAWAALQGPVPLPAQMQVASGFYLEGTNLIVANWLTPVVFAALAAAASSCVGRLGSAAGIAVAATSLAMTDRIVGASLMGLVLVGGLTVDNQSGARPFGLLLVIAGLAIGVGAG